MAEAERVISELLALAANPNIAVKTSSLIDLGHDEGDMFPYKSVHDLFYRTLDAFGSERVFWASDLTGSATDYPTAVRVFGEELDQLSSSEREWLMGRGITTWLGWNRDAVV